MNKVLLHITLAVLAWPFGCIVFWCTLTLFLGLGIALPYKFVGQEFVEFGFWRIAIWGTVTNLMFVGGAVIAFRFMKDEYLNKMFAYGFAEMVIIPILIAGHIDGWSW